MGFWHELFGSFWWTTGWLLAGYWLTFNKYPAVVKLGRGIARGSMLLLGVAFFVCPVTGHWLSSLGILAGMFIGLIACSLIADVMHFIIYGQMDC